MNAIETHALAKSYGQKRALHDCTLAIPEGRVVALVGPNGAGKTTFLNLVVGLAVPTSGEVTVLGGRPAGSLAALDGIAFVAQNTPLYKNLSARDLLHETRNLNRRFDQGYAERRLDELGIPLRQRAGEMSGGQQAQLALTLALARLPQLLVLDEPLANLDPIAREDFMATVMTAAAEDGVSVVLSSHVLAELERVADYLVLVTHGDIQLVGEVEDLLATYRMLTGPATESERLAQQWNVVHASRSASQALLLVRRDSTANSVPPGWDERGVTLEELTLAYLRESRRRNIDPSNPQLGRRVVGGDEMTAVTASVSPAAEAGLRPLPWRRMGWVIWRHHRVALAGVVAFLGVLAVWLWTAGLSLHHEFAAAVACRPVGSANCSNLANIFDSTNVILKGGFVLQPVPALIGAFVGSVVLAREFETETFRYAWTQALGRWRWAVAKLVALGVAVAALAGAFGVLLSWYYQPYIAAQNAPNVSGASPLSAGLFDLRGVAFPAWTLAAFAIGVLAGMLIRRIVPAIVATLAVYAGLALLAANLLRQHYLAPLVARNLNIPGSGWVISEWWTKAGRIVFGARPPLSLLPQLCPSTFTASGHGVNSTGSLSPTQCLLQHGYTEWADYQPISHLWPFQWIEGGWLLVLAALLVTVTVLLVRRRVA